MQEEREIYYGRIFAILVLARANRFQEESINKVESTVDAGSSDEEMENAKEDSSGDESMNEDSDEDSASGDSDDLEGEEITNPLDWAITTLNDLRNRKEQLEQLCYYTIGEILRQLPKAMVLEILNAVHSSLLPASISKLTSSQLYFVFLVEHEYQVRDPYYPFILGL